MNSPSTTNQPRSYTFSSGRSYESGQIYGPEDVGDDAREYIQEGSCYIFLGTGNDMSMYRITKACKDDTRTMWEGGPNLYEWIHKRVTNNQMQSTS